MRCYSASPPFGGYRKIVRTGETFSFAGSGCCLRETRRVSFKKLLTIKTVRFYGKVFFRRPQRGLREKLLNDKIFIFWREGVVYAETLQVSA
jgi:hypothetical protein